MRIACFLILLLAACGQPLAPTSDVWVLHNATIYTVNPDQPTAQALAIDGDRIVQVGTEEAVLAAYPEARRVDAEGRTVVPGLIDAHAHLTGLAGTRLMADLRGTTSKAEIVERLQAFAAEVPEGAWILGRGWDQNDWGEGSQAFPTRADLDAAFPERPVWLRRIDGHASWANTAALEVVGLDSLRALPDPEGGRIVRAADGIPTGVFIDAAEQIIDAQVPEPTEAQLEQALQAAIAEAVRYGLTGLHDAGLDTREIERYRRAVEEDRFDLRVYAMVGDMDSTFQHFCTNGPLIGFGDRLTVRSIKFYMDGALGSRGAALLEPYDDDPSNRGLLMQNPDSFFVAVQQAMACGFQVNTHAIGDSGNRVALDTYARAMQAVPDHAGRHRIEHAQVVAPEDIPRFAELGVIAAVQPTHATSDMYWAEDRVGAERIRGGYAWRSLLDAGARLALGSDFPVEHVDPLLGFYAAVTRQDAEGWPDGGWYAAQRLTREEALRGFTLDAAYAAFQEDELGSLEPGKFADFVILSHDIMTVPASQILETDVVATYLGGEAVYRHDAAGGR